MTFDINDGCITITTVFVSIICLLCIFQTKQKNRYVAADIIFYVQAYLILFGPKRIVHVCIFISNKCQLPRCIICNYSSRFDQTIVSIKFHSKRKLQYQVSLCARLCYKVCTLSFLISNREETA